MGIKAASPAFNDNHSKRLIAKEQKMTNKPVYDTLEYARILTN